MKKLTLVLLMCTFLFLISGCEENAKETNTNSDNLTNSNQSDTPTTTCEHSFGEWVVESAATCQKEGAKLHECQKCGLKEIETIKILEHTIVVEKKKDATCIESGLTEGKYCSSCNTIMEKQVPILAKGHSYDNDKDDKCNTCNFTRVLNCKHKNIKTIKGSPASCVEEGTTDGKVCKDCEQIIQKQEKILAKGHSEETDKAVASTCTKTGLTEGKHCSVCNYVIVAQKVVGLTNHTPITDKAVAPTCTKSGLTEGKHCSICNYVITEQKKVDAKGHNEVIDKAVAPTCTKKGLTEGKHCSSCGEVIVAQSDVAFVSHSFSNNSCTICGEKGSAGLEFQIYNKNSYTVSGIGTCTDVDIIIPKTHNGLPVIRVENNAFKGNYKIKSIQLQSGIQAVGNSSFEDCAALEKIYIPQSTTSFGTSAFHKCIKVTHVYYEGTLNNWMAINFSVGGNPCCGPNNTKYGAANSSLYINGELLTHLVIPDNTTIRQYTFTGCDSIKSVTIGKNVVIGNNAFWSCGGLSEVTISENATINNYAFYSCRSLDVVKIYDGCLVIGDYAFNSDYLINSGMGGASIYLPKSIECIKSNAISDNCGIYYAGSQEDWGKIVFGANTYTHVQKYNVQY